MLSRMIPSRRTATIITIVFVVCLAGFGLFRLFEPTETSFFPKCTLFQMTGLHCPGCGSTRAVSALVHGRWMDALRFNPLLIIGLPLLVGGVFYQLKRERQGLATSAWFPICVLIVVLVYFIARNVPSPTRSWLAPPNYKSMLTSPTATTAPRLRSPIRSRQRHWGPWHASTRSFVDPLSARRFAPLAPSQEPLKHQQPRSTD